MKCIKSRSIEIRRVEYVFSFQFFLFFFCSTIRLESGNTPTSGSHNFSLRWCKKKKRKETRTFYMSKNKKFNTRINRKIVLLENGWKLVSRCINVSLKSQRRKVERRYSNCACNLAKHGGTRKEKKIEILNSIARMYVYIYISIQCNSKYRNLCTGSCVFGTRLIRKLWYTIGRFRESYVRLCRYPLVLQLGNNWLIRVYILHHINGFTFCGQKPCIV